MISNRFYYSQGDGEREREKESENDKRRNTENECVGWLCFWKNTAGWMSFGISS